LFNLVVGLRAGRRESQNEGGSKHS
jgi:hypothetical protein